MQRAIQLALVAALAAVPVLAQQKRVSPHEKVEATVGGAKVTIDYGRPSLKGRKAVGGQLVPYGQVWRTGADEATMLTTDKDLMIGELHVPAGSYALFTLPTEKGWTLIVNKTAKQWGAFSYKQDADLGRVPMKVSKAPSTVETFTIAIKPAGGNKATLEMSWEDTMASVGITAH
jgi:hypothetical protein